MCWQYIVNKFFLANGIYKMADILQDVRALNETPPTIQWRSGVW